MAAQEGNLETVEVLLKAGANMEAKDNEGRTPLHLAVAAGKLETIDALITAGADTTIKNNKGETPFQLTNNDAIKALLLQAGAKT